MKRASRKNINSVATWDAIYGTEKGLTTTSWNCHSAITVLSAVIPKGSHVLDCACGTAFGPKNTAERRPDLRWSGCDFSPVVVQRQKTHPAVPWMGMSIVDIRERLPFAENQFDVVMCCEVLEHLEKPEKIIPELARVASRQIILSVPFENAIATIHHVWSIDEPEFRGWLEPYGRVETYIVRHGTDMIGVCDIR